MIMGFMLKKKKIESLMDFKARINMVRHVIIGIITLIT